MARANDKKIKTSIDNLLKLFYWLNKIHQQPADLCSASAMYLYAMNGFREDHFKSPVIHHISLATDDDVGIEAEHVALGPGRISRVFYFQTVVQYWKQDRLLQAILKHLQPHICKVANECVI